MKMLFAIDGELQRKVSLSFCLVDFDVQRWKKKYKKRRWKASAAAANHGAVWRETEWGSWIGSDFNQQSQEQQRKALKRKIRKSHAHKKKLMKAKEKWSPGWGWRLFFSISCFALFFLLYIGSIFAPHPSAAKVGSCKRGFSSFLFNQLKPSPRIVWYEFE